MSKEELDTLLAWLELEVERRKKLGEYSQEAASISNLFAVCQKIVKHLARKK
jgi:hypothetical protein